MTASVDGPRPGLPEDEMALLGRVAALLEPRLRAHVDAFYAAVAARPGPAEVVARLSAEEVEHLKDAQARHLMTLLDPSVDMSLLLGRSREVGRIHAMVGVEMDWYAEAVADHQREMFTLKEPVSGGLDASRAMAMVQARSMADLHGALQGYRDVDMAQARVMMQLSRSVAQARTVADLARGVLEALSLLDGMVAVFLIRPDTAGIFRFEAGAGTGVQELVGLMEQPSSPVVSSLAESPLGSGNAGRAWRTGDIICSDSLLSDPATAPWRPWAERFGWRASAAVPLTRVDGTPQALLSLCAEWPGYFSYASRAAMLHQVKEVVERALEHLEQEPHTAAVQRYGARATHLELLRAGEVEMLFQPVVGLPDGEPVRFEALARLRHDGSLVSPSDFLPAFGDEELLRLFEIALEQSLTALEEWESHGLVTGASINMPVAAAWDDRYLQAVTDAFARHLVSPDRLTLELLETGSMLGSLAVRKAGVDRFKQLGVEVAQDDLGAGHSSLIRLRHIDFDVVKIDQSLIRGTDVDPRTALQFVQPISDIAHNLGLHVVLEGLETPGLIEAAAQLGVDAGQGYAIARPMPRAAVVDWARNFRLAVDPEHPRTELGGLAAHVAWEHRVAAFGSLSSRLVLAGSDTCALSGYLRDHRSEDRHVLEVLHARVHAEAFARRGRPAHREAWDRLVTSLGEG